MSKKRPLIIGHRGHEFGPDNTLETFQDAIDCGAEMIELDVWLTADGVPVVYHDEFLALDGQRQGRIAEYTASALEKLEWADGAKIPRLERVLVEILPRVPLDIELKFPNLNYRPLVGAVMDLVRSIKAEQKVLLSSFFHQSLEIVNRIEPSIATAPIFGVPTGAPHKHDLQKLASLGPWQSQIGFPCPVAVVDYLMLDEEVIAEFNNSKIAVVAYTVDEPEDMRRMRSLGVDGIVTKRPKALREILTE